MLDQCSHPHWIAYAVYELASGHYTSVSSPSSFCCPRRWSISPIMRLFRDICLWECVQCHANAFRHSVACFIGRFGSSGADLCSDEGVLASESGRMPFGDSSGSLVCMQWPVASERQTQLYKLSRKSTRGVWLTTAGSIARVRRAIV